MKLNSIQTQNFKGYDACPLKSLYMQGVRDKSLANVFKELKESCEREKIELLLFNDPKFYPEFNGKYSKGLHPWTQDDKTFVRVDGKTKILTEDSHEQDQYFAQKNFLSGLGYSRTYNKSFLTGGNSFIGKKPNGEIWILMGDDELEKSGLRDVCREYGVKMKNIYSISQPNFHIDMAIRPIGYPYVLVNNEEMALQNAQQQSNKLNERTKHFYNELYSHDVFAPRYARFDETVRQLKKYGFIPIGIGGVYSDEINYMNAIVNKHPDGTISYITNSTKNSKFKWLDKVFEDELRAKVPNIRNVYFISGGRNEYYPKLSTMMEILSRRGGGIHCLTLEEPNFEIWE